MSSYLIRSCADVVPACCGEPFIKVQDSSGDTVFVCVTCDRIVTPENLEPHRVAPTSVPSDGIRRNL